MLICDFWLLGSFSPSVTKVIKELVSKLDNKKEWNPGLTRNHSLLDNVLRFHAEVKRSLATDRILSHMILQQTVHLKS